MVFDKISLSALIFLFLASAAFSADVGIDFALVNMPPTVNLTLSPLSPFPGTITFNSDATYHDTEMQTGSVNLTWYVGATMVQPGGFYPAVAPGGTVPAISFTAPLSSGQTVRICADVSDGINPPVVACRSTVVQTPGGPSKGLITIAAPDSPCPNSPMELTFTRSGSSAGAFTLFIRQPNSSIETIRIEATRESYTYVPTQSGEYYFGAIEAGNNDVVDDTARVGEIFPIIRMPACSFMEDPRDRSLSPTGDPVTVYIVDNTGVAQDGQINITWNANGLPQSTSQSGGSFSFVPRSQGSYHIEIQTASCTAATDFNPNVCLGNQTINETIQYTMGNQTFYIWRMPPYMGAGKGCSPVSCNVTADCCEGYCFNKKCVIPPAAPEQPWLTLKTGCYGLAQCTDPAICWFVCNLVWVLLVAVSGYAAYIRRKVREESVMLFLIPLFVAVVFIPLAGLVAAFGALGAAFYLKRMEAKKSAPKA
ncbi:MAG: hypothetical protein PHV13_03960 [Candidatus ainarchaeum sp.]|nr:hypothetical protein [Candidatus ainarchaeum sp.]